MEVIRRLAELRKERNDLQRGRGEIMVKIIEFEAELERAKKAKRDKILDRFKNRQPLTLGTLEEKVKHLSAELDEHRSIVEAIDSKLTEIRPELEELEAEQRLAERWADFALHYISARVLSSQLNARVKRVFDAAPERKIQMSSGEYRIEKRIAACVGENGRYAVGKLETEALKALRRIDPERFPRPEQVDLMIRNAWPAHRRGSEYEDRRLLDDIAWGEFLSAQRYYQQNFGIDIGPDESAVEAKIKEALPSAPKPAYH